MRKIFSIMLLVALLGFILAGCGQDETVKPFERDNEIYTYQRIDPEKTQIVVSRTGNIPLEDLCLAFEKENPDVQVICLDITGGNSNYTPLKDWILHGDKPDIVISAADFFDEEITELHFENLSQNPVIGNYESAALQRTAINGNIYWLPGPSNISTMIYNKTLFEKYGWSVPNTFDEFVSLCDRIRKDTNGTVEPWNPNAKYGDELTRAMEAIIYAEVFGGLENRTWYNGFVAGEEKSEGHLEPYTDVIQTLIDHDILRQEHFSYSATTRGNEFQDGKIAMVNMNIYDPDNDKFDFDYMPFPTTKGDMGFLSDSFSCFVGLPVMEHTEKQKDAVQRFVGFFSSKDGQEAFIGKSLRVSNVRDVDMGNYEDLAALEPVVKAGNMFELLKFNDEITGESRLSLYDIATDMVMEGMTGEECLREADAKSVKEQGTVTADTAEPEIICEVAEDMTILETSFMMADAYRSIADADIGLITNNEAYRGNLMRIYAGGITEGIITVLKPRSLDNDSTLLKVSMTGQQLLEVLNNPVGNETTANCIYAYSGLKCEVAPWNELGQKYVSVKLADGSQPEPDKLYTVAIWQGTIFDDYITETLEAFDGTWEELMTSYLGSQATVAPARDGRIKLIWD